jgi:hypothetical protein
LGYNLMCCRDVAQFGSALAWGVRGRRFKSCHPDNIKGNQRFPQVADKVSTKIKKT